MLFRSSDWVVVHACKSPCHQKAIGYRRNLPNTHPNYLILENEKHLYLNIVDMKMPLLHKFAESIMLTALDFIEKHISTKNVLIHCNLGQSRSPSLGLLFLAKRKNDINNETYQKAKEDFIKLYPQFNPGNGIESYLINYWSHLF